MYDWLRSALDPLTTVQLYLNISSSFRDPSLVGATPSIQPLPPSQPNWEAGSKHPHAYPRVPPSSSAPPAVPHPPGSDSTDSTCHHRLAVTPSSPDSQHPTMAATSLFEVSQHTSLYHPNRHLIRHPMTVVQCAVLASPTNDSFLTKPSSYVSSTFWQLQEHSLVKKVFSGSLV